MASALKVTNPVTQMMKLITYAVERRADCRQEHGRVFSQTPEDQLVGQFQRFPAISDFPGTDFALKEFAIKAQTTILERREQ